MKIKNSLIINNTDYGRWAVDELYSTDFSKNNPIEETTGEKLHYSDFYQHIIVDERGVLFPTSIDMTNDTPYNYEVVYTRKDYINMLDELIKDNEPDAWNEYINVLTNKN